MSTFILLTITGLGLGAMYFLIASGLSLIYGLMGVLNFAHGAFLTVGSYASWWMSDNVFDGVNSLWLRFLLGAVCGLVAGAVFAALVELVLIRPLYQRHIEQALVTVGLSIASSRSSRVSGGRTSTRTPFRAGSTRRRRSSARTFPTIAGSRSRPRGAVLVLLQLFLRRTRYGLIIRAGVENRAMVTALGIDVRKAFTLVFAIGGIAAAIAGVLSGVYFTTIDPNQGTSLLIFAFIVVVIGGLGSIGGSAVAAVVVGLLQQYVNYYGASQMGDIAVVLLLGLVLLARPRGLAGALAT